jgi:hypothetical protein
MMHLVPKAAARQNSLCFVHVAAEFVCALEFVDAADEMGEESAVRTEQQRCRPAAVAAAEARISRVLVGRLEARQRQRAAEQKKKEGEDQTAVSERH